MGANTSIRSGAGMQMAPESTMTASGMSLGNGVVLQCGSDVWEQKKFDQVSTVTDKSVQIQMPYNTITFVPPNQQLKQFNVTCQPYKP